MWGHGYVYRYFQEVPVGLWMKRWYCPEYGQAHTIRPNGYQGIIHKSREFHWHDLSEFFNYPEPIRKVISTTNASESLNGQLRKVTKNRSTFSTDDVKCKIIYLAMRNVAKKCTMSLQHRGQTVNQFSILFPDRIPGAV